MSSHLYRAITDLKRKVLDLCAVVEENLQLSVQAVLDQDRELAEKVIAKDKEIDLTEVDVEEEGLKLLALYQPVATDLRFVVAVLKINNDLERVGDMAVNLAERAIGLSHSRFLEPVYDFAAMAEKSQSMLKRALDSLVNLDVPAARQVCSEDDQVDHLNWDAVEHVEAAIREHPENMNAYLQMLMISRYLERIADHATNIAEDVIYMVEGDIVRHGLKR